MFESGIPNLDRILGGGIPEGDVLLIMGPPGSGKTILAFQLAFHVMSSGLNVIYVSTLSESPARLVKHLQTFSFFDGSQIEKHLFLSNIYPVVKKGVDPTLDALMSVVKKHEAKLLVIDGLATIRDIHSESPQLRTFIYELATALSALDCTTIVTSDMITSSSPELTMSDSIIVLGIATEGTRVARTIQPQKVRGQSPLLGIHSMTIGPGGISVYPRIESLTGPSLVGLSSDRLSLGLPEFDLMLSGGLLKGSVTLIAGAPGTGKTLISLQFMLEGARRGEKGLLIGFRESPRQLMDKMHSFGLDLETPVEEGLIKIVHRVPIDLLVDEIFAEMVQEIQTFKPARLVMDSVAEVEYAITEERRRRTVMTCVAEFVRAHGATALSLRELSQVAGPELDFSDSPLALLGENLILLRYVEFRSELYRILSILKMRDTEHDHTIRQYEITPRGLHVLSIMESTEGILSGIAQLPSEMRVKRSGSAPQLMGEK